jgi:hypothetical protein
VTPTELDANREGFLCYFDTEVVSFSPSPDANIGKDSYLTLGGRYFSLGYKPIIADPSFTYSMKEQGFLDLPLYVLPVGASDSPDSFVRVVSSPIQIAYERAPLVELVQNFITSRGDRVLSAGLLARHFLPAYVSYDASYIGGSDASVVVRDIIDYISKLPVETPLDVSEIQDLITARGGNPITPTTVSATLYDWSRRMWVEFSQDKLGGPNLTDLKVPYNGSPRVTFFSPGQDVSGASVLPSGERLNLQRR